MYTMSKSQLIDRKNTRRHTAYIFLLKMIVIKILWYSICLLRLPQQNIIDWVTYQFSSVQSLSQSSLFVTPWTEACQASLPIANSQSLLKLMSVESVIPSNHLILCRPLLLLPSIFPSIRVFSSESVLCISGQSIGVSISTSVLPKNTRTDLL